MGFWAHGLSMGRAGFMQKPAQAQACGPLRVYSTTHPTAVHPFLIGYLTVILAPSVLAAACYMTYGRIVWYITPSDRRTFSTLWIPARWITLFVSFDMFAFLIQLVGTADVWSAYTSNKSPKDQATEFDHGLHVLRLGLIIQLLCFATFVVIGLRFVLVSRNWVENSTTFDRRWKRCAWMVNGAGGLIMLRAIYRVFEFSQSISNSSASRSTSSSQAASRPYLVTHEWPFWICDALPILAVLVLFNLIHPGTCLPGAFTHFRLNKKRLVNMSKTQGREVPPRTYNYAMA